MIKAKVIDIFDHVVLIEYSDKKGLQRKYLSREFLPVLEKNIQVEVDKSHLSSAIEYSDVDLVETIGSHIAGYPTEELQQAFRKAGLWTRGEYLSKPWKIQYVLKKFPGLDVQFVQNSTRRNDNE